jgi:hypothetical protein
MTVIAAAPDAETELVLTGVLTREDHETYHELAFDVPAGVERLTVTFSHTGREQRATIDLGLFDPERFRGWSGGDKMSFTLSATDATPSYLPGPIRPGRWLLILGVPNIRPGCEAAYEARIRFGRGEATEVSSFSAAPLEVGARWYRGDLHMHTCHSDGTVESQGGTRVPGPVYRTVEAAAAKGVDFIAVTDHNAVSHHHSLRELQPYFDKLLLIPGVEVTTFQGHAGVLGAVGFVEFRLTSPHLPRIGDLLDVVERQHGLFAINHPALPSNEYCMGCGWTTPGTDYARVAAVEVVNGGAAAAQGGTADGPFSGVPFWEARLNEGHRPTAIGGSDNHKPDADPIKASAVGAPTTVVWAENLSERAILDAIRAGRVFVDVEGTGERVLELTAGHAGAWAMMGETLAAPAGAQVRFTVRVRGLAGARLDVIQDGAHGIALADAATVGDDVSLDFSLPSDGARHWVRADVRSSDGARTLMIGNPIYLNG